MWAFYKRMMGLPTYTPNYMLSTELGLEETQVKARKRRDNYELKIMRETNEKKYIVRMAAEMKRIGIGFEKEIVGMSGEMGLIAGDLKECDYPEILSMHRRWLSKEHGVEM